MNLKIPMFVTALAVLFAFQYSGLSLAQDTPPGGVLEQTREELIAERSLNTKKFVNSDGSETWQLGSRPLHFQNPDNREEWLEISTRLEENAGWENRTTNVAVRLPVVLGEGVPIYLGHEFALRWNPQFLKVELYSGEVIELASLQPSEGQRVEGRNNAIIYREVFPGTDLTIEVVAGGINASLAFRQFDFDVEKVEISKIFLDASLEAETYWLEAMEQSLAENGDAPYIPIHFGTIENEYVIGVASGEEGVFPLHTGDDVGGSAVAGDGERHLNIAEYLSNRRTQHYLNIGVVFDGASTSTAALTAIFKLKSKDKIVTQGALVASDAITAQKGNKVVVGLPIGVHKKSPPPPPIPAPPRESGGVPSSTPSVNLCAQQSDCATGMKCSSGVCVRCFEGDCTFNGSFLSSNTVGIVSFDGLKKIRANFGTFGTSGNRIRSMSLGYRVAGKDRRIWGNISKTLPERIVDASYVMAKQVPGNLLGNTTSAGSIALNADKIIKAIAGTHAYNIGCTVYPVACGDAANNLLSTWNKAPNTWGTRTWVKQGRIFADLDHIARDDFDKALKSGGDYFHIGFEASKSDNATAFSDFRLEFTTVPATAEIELEDRKSVV